jgi:hypothetical protein
MQTTTPQFDTEPRNDGYDWVRTIVPGQITAGEALSLVTAVEAGSGRGVTPYDLHDVRRRLDASRVDGRPAEEIGYKMWHSAHGGTG